MAMYEQVVLKCLSRRLVAEIVDSHNRVLVPCIIVSVNYLAFSMGLVHVPVVIQPFTVPVGISGFIATGGDLRGSLLQCFDLAVSALLYYPFFKAWERILVAREEATAQEATQSALSQQRTLQATASTRKGE